MNTETSTVTKLRLTDLMSPSPHCLDPVTVILEDDKPGKGKIIIECYGESWSSYWGGMGKKHVAEFFCRCDDHYIAKNLSSLSGGIPDYEKLADVARAQVIQLRRHDDLGHDEARDLFDRCGNLGSDKDSLNQTAMHEIFGDDWWHSIPEKTNPDYAYLCRIIGAVREGLNLSGLSSPHTQPASPIEATVPCPECMSADIQRERLALLATIKPFAKAFEIQRCVHDRTQDADAPEGMQDFLDRNTIVPSGTKVGDWRKLANEYAIQAQVEA